MGEEVDEIKADEDPGWTIQVADQDPKQTLEEESLEPASGAVNGAPEPLPPPNDETPYELNPQLVAWAITVSMAAVAEAEQDEFYRATPEELEDVVPTLTARLNATLSQELLAQLQSLEELLEWWPTLKFFWRRALHAYRVHVTGSEGRRPKGEGNPNDHARSDHSQSPGDDTELGNGFE